MTVERSLMYSSLPASPSPQVLSIWNKRTKSTLSFYIKLFIYCVRRGRRGNTENKSYCVELDLLEYPHSSNSSSLILAHKPLFASKFLHWKCYILLRTAHFTRKEVYFVMFQNRINANCVHNPTLKTWLTCT